MTWTPEVLNSDPRSPRLLTSLLPLTTSTFIDNWHDQRNSSVSLVRPFWTCMRSAVNSSFCPNRNVLTMLECTRPSQWFVICSILGNASKNSEKVCTNLMLITSNYMHNGKPGIGRKFPQWWDPFCWRALWKLSPTESKFQSNQDVAREAYNGYQHWLLYDFELSCCQAIITSILQITLRLMCLKHCVSDSQYIPSTIGSSCIGHYNPWCGSLIGWLEVNSNISITTSQCVINNAWYLANVKQVHHGIISSQYSIL